VKKKHNRSEQKKKDNNNKSIENRKQGAHTLEKLGVKQLPVSRRKSGCTGIKIAVLATKVNKNK